jgi:putative transcriptional regulator
MIALESRFFEASTGEPAAPSRALIQRVRWHTGLSQSEFADVYGIELEHLRALECGALTPDRALVAYLTVIDRAPDTVRAALRTC